MKKFIAGLIVGLMLSATAVFAGESISATFADFNFLINGQPKTVNTKPIVYNGTSYFPIRELSTLLGYSVDYQADTRTISLSAQSETPTSSSTPNAGGFISLNELVEQYEVGVVWSATDGYIFKGSTRPENATSEIHFNIPPLVDGDHAVDTEYGSFIVRMKNQRAYVKPDEILKLVKALN